MKIKDYAWALEGIAAIILLVGFVMMLTVGVDELSTIIIQIFGLGVLFFTIMRIKPILASRNEKDFVIIMLLEILVTLAAGVMMLFASDFVLEDDIFTFARLSGAVFFIRGIVHFYTTSKRYELHDLVSFFVNIIFIAVGFWFIVENKDLLVKFVWILYVLTLLLVAFFTYRSYNDYNNFRQQKMNKLKMKDYLDKKEKEDVIEDPKSINDQINPKNIDEPQEERPSVDVN